MSVTCTHTDPPRHILVVDCDPARAVAFARALEGYDVAIVGRAVDALHALWIGEFDTALISVDVTGSGAVELLQVAGGHRGVRILFAGGDACGRPALAHSAELLRRDCGGTVSRAVLLAFIEGSAHFYP